MSKYVMVDSISMFRMRYVVEVPDDVEQGKYPCTPEDYAKDSVTCEDVREFSQEHLDEVISSVREVTKEEAIEQFKKDQDYLYSWSDEQIVKNAFTEIGFNRKAYEEEEEKIWRNSMNS